MSQYTLAQALRRQAKIKGQLAELTKRAEASVSYLDEAPPAFDFARTMDQIAQLRSELTQLDTRVGLTNARTPADTPRGRFASVTELVRKLQELRASLKWIRSLTVRARAETTEYSHEYDEEMKRIRVAQKWKCDLPEAAKAELVDALQKEFDELNNAVERINNATMLVEG